jgi:hypothetical protein
MRGIVALILGIGLAANGLIMLVVPSTWYAIVPGVAETGPFNAHFIRDIGVAYLVCGAALAWFALERIAQPAALAAAAFLALHALVHLWDAAAGREHAHQLLLDVSTIFLPPVLAFWITLAPGRGPKFEDKEKRDDQVVSAAVDR